MNYKNPVLLISFIVMLLAPIAIGYNIALSYGVLFGVLAGFANLFIEALLVFVLVRTNHIVVNLFTFAVMLGTIALNNYLMNP